MFTYYFKFINSIKRPKVTKATINYKKVSYSKANFTTTLAYSSTANLKKFEKAKNRLISKELTIVTRMVQYPFFLIITNQYIYSI